MASCATPVIDLGVLHVELEYYTCMCYTCITHVLLHTVLYVELVYHTHTNQYMCRIYIPVCVKHV